MADEELEKLRQRVEKDPASRLFLPLAEEYRKAGKLDEAITVLLNGLERHPGYTSARVAIGRIYLEKSMAVEARTEFEKVVGVVPDNLFAHKKLADIYRESGDTERAVSEYKTILVLNPLDDDARACLDSLSGLSLEEPADVLPVEAEAAAEAAGVFPLQEETEEALTEELLRGKPLDESAPLDDDFEEFSRSYSESAEAESIETEIPMEDTEDFFAEPVMSPGGQVFDEGREKKSALKDEEAKPAVIDFSQADACVAREDYVRAMEMYGTILREAPGNTQVLQRISELRAFLKMIGKSDEVVASRLEGLLGGIRRRFGKG